MRLSSLAFPLMLACGTFVQLSTGQECVPDLNIVGLWHMDELSGPLVTDASANSNHGTATGTSVVTGVLGQAREFDGQGDYIDLPESASLSFPFAQLTLEAWIYLYSYPLPDEAHHIISSGNQNDFDFSVRSDGHLTAHLFLSTGPGQVDGSGVIPFNTWAHVAMTYDGSNVRFYINGFLDSTIPRTGTVGGSPQGESFSIGAYFYNGSFIQSFDGKIDEVKISDIARQPDELGISWFPQSSGGWTLQSVQFVDVTTGWAVGSNGIILRTTDSGDTWTTQVSGTLNHLYSVCFIDATTGWAVGSLRTILKTTNAGNTWITQIGSAPVDLWSVCFVDAMRGWTVGSGGAILHTINGGEQWIAQSSGTTDYLNSVIFSDENTGWIAGRSEPGRVLHTTDGGVTWTNQAIGAGFGLWDIAFTDSKTGWVVGDYGWVSKTTNGGATWIQQTTNVSIGLRSVDFVDPNIGWAASEDYGAPIILHTKDGGTTWIGQMHLETASHSVDFPDANNGWAVGPSYILRTTTGGNVAEPPISTSLVSPSDGSIVSTPLTFSWNPVSSALWYTLQISTSPYFITRVLNQTNIAEASYGVDTLQQDMTYYWRVSLTDPCGTSDWSDVWSFTTGSPSGDPLAQFGICYGGTGSADISNPGALIAIDPVTGDGTLIGPTGILGTSVPALAIKSTGEVYTMSSSSNSNLYTVNASTGAGTLVANTGLNTPDALAFDSNDVLYAVSNNNNLYTVDVTTGVATLVGPTGIVTKALSYDPTDGTMYGSSADDKIYIVDLTTGASTLIGTTGIGGSTHALRFNQEGNLFGIKGSATTPYTLISIDKGTGAGTTIGPIGFTAVLGLASRVLYAPSAAPVTVEVEIDSLLKFVPAEGDTFPYTVTITNHTSLTQVVDWWTKVLRPIGNPIDPLSGPEVLVLNRFQTVVIDTPLIPLPFNARTGDYSLIGFIGRYLADTLDADTTDFHKLPAIACNEISRFQARCRPGGIVQARINLTNANHTGDLVEFTIDDVPYETTVGSNRRALISLAGFNIGSHDVELTEPPGCYPPLVVTCPAGLAKAGDDFWEDDESWEVPVTTTLLENYPDPFNPSTTIRYELSEDAHVTLKVYNMLGELVVTLVDEPQTMGYRSVVWNGRNGSGACVASGIYIYRMAAGGFTATRRMLLVK